ncbi:hypothetical protein F5Y12DRAFT_718156 [Xylaria sp. FL1777]|nr:hypothetical protein F5Y12DRAFT_718156 [Xylaria sp. FL1777]
MVFRIRRIFLTVTEKEEEKKAILDRHLSHSGSAAGRDGGEEVCHVDGNANHQGDHHDHRDHDDNVDSGVDVDVHHDAVVVDYGILDAGVQVDSESREQASNDVGLDSNDDDDDDDDADSGYYCLSGGDGDSSDDRNA